MFVFNFLKRLFVMIKGNASNALEAAEEKQAVVLFEEKIRDASEAYRKSTDGLTDIMASKEEELRAVESMEISLKEHDIVIKECIAKGRDDLARDVAERISELEEEIKIRRGHIAKLEEAEKLINDSRGKVRRKIESMKQKKVLFSSKKALNDALKKTSEIMGGSSIVNDDGLTAMANKIEKDQQFESDKINASLKLEEEDGGDLTEKLKDAGISSKNKIIDDVMARYK